MANNRPSMPSYDFLNSGGLSEAMKASIDDLTRNTEQEAARDTDFEAVMHTTSSSNPNRPRTVSAGYDSAEEKLTVVFRDGTWWEYRNVPKRIWEEFKSAPSKGKYMQRSLDHWGDMGPADIKNMPVHRRAQVSGLQNLVDKLYGGLGRDQG